MGGIKSGEGNAEGDLGEEGNAVEGNSDWGGDAWGEGETCGAPGLPTGAGIVLGENRGAGGVDGSGIFVGLGAMGSKDGDDEGCTGLVGAADLPQTAAE